MIKEKTVKKLTLLLFVLYLLFLTFAILFKFSFSIPHTLFERVVNLIPFYRFRMGGRLFTDALLNFLIFVPFGIFLKMLACPGGLCVLAALLCSLAFETLQYVFCIGISDVTDLITNTLGAAFGVFFYLSAVSLSRSKQKCDLALLGVCAVGEAAAALVIFFQAL